MRNFTILAAFATSVCAQEVSVATFGAKPNDGNDQTEAIQEALDYCAKTEAKVLRFPPGTYNVAAIGTANQALTVQNCNGLTIQGTGATLKVTSWTVGLLIEKCTNVELLGLAIDYSPLPFAEVVIKSNSSAGTVVQVVGGTAPLAGKNAVTSIFQYDLDKGRPAVNAFDWYATSDTGSVALVPINATEALLPASLKLSKYPAGTAFVARYVTYGANAVMAISCDDILLKNTVINSAPGMAGSFADCNGIQVLGATVDIPVGSNRWISTNADGFHFTLCRGNIDVTTSVLRKMGDDAFNIGALMLTGKSVPGSHTIVLKHGAGQGMAPMRVGDALEFAAPSTPHKASFTANVVSCPGTGMLTRLTVTLDKVVPSNFVNGAIVYDASATPTATSIVKCTIQNNRARAFWIQTTNVFIANCDVQGCSGPAAELRCDVNSWWEGPGPTKVAFNTCSFGDCNYGPGRNLAVIDTYALNADGSTDASVVVDDVTFKYCTFKDDETDFLLESAGKVWIQWCSFPEQSVGHAQILLGPAVTLSTVGNVLPDGVMLTASAKIP